MPVRENSSTADGAELFQNPQTYHARAVTQQKYSDA
jgi:hypothetical protein